MYTVIVMSRDELLQLSLACLNPKLTPLLLRQMPLLQIIIIINCSPLLFFDGFKLGSSVLDIQGAFSLLNALRRIRPGEKHTLVLAFSPSLEKKVG